ncbi:EthD family reductase [Aneurinibacillus uraniidurans]|uniref:EthD family reductase n=1 Tax=Aneurinibacillus uraniidurans TaxID=2966586 RepID=UPI00234C02D2|nr:EthD family reductase [Aneurinibacillus sp. B1]WCN38386.1 EthD family reductase [Aneurinibacillus sp. B1]
MIVLSFYYKQNVSFNEEYYYKQHIPLVKNEVFKMGACKYEVKKFVTAADGSAPPYQFSFSLHFPSQKQLDEFFSNPKLKDLQNDVANYYDGNPDVFIEEITIQEDSSM